MDFIVTEPDPLPDSFFDKFDSVWSQPPLRCGTQTRPTGVRASGRRDRLQRAPSEGGPEPPGT